VNVPFHASPRSSVGIEMELELVDAATRELTSKGTEILDALSAAGGVDLGGARVKHELMECTVEVTTSVCGTIAEARADLEGAIAALRPHAEERGAALLCSGTHPFSHWTDQVISPDPRYAQLIETMQWPARQLQIFGIHVHVGVRSGAKAVAMAGALAQYIPHFLALSASSPFWLGHDTGLASCRSKIFEQLPTAGLPYRLQSWEDFEGFMTTLINARAIESIREVWWDVRPHPDFGTVELRICDGLPTLSEVAAVAALSQCLVEWMDTLFDRGFALPQPKAWIVRENKWRAVRHGVEAEIIVDEQGDLVKVREAVADLVEELSPIAARLGCLPELRRCLSILESGPSYLRQRDVAGNSGTLTAVVDALVTELATDTPLAGPR
jgi:carboxylate-amine ligase